LGQDAGFFSTEEAGEGAVGGMAIGEGIEEGRIGGEGRGEVAFEPSGF